VRTALGSSPKVEPLRGAGTDLCIAPRIKHRSWLVVGWLGHEGAGEIRQLYEREIKRAARLATFGAKIAISTIRSEIALTHAQWLVGQ
jgi:hypothetical protein